MLTIELILFVCATFLLGGIVKGAVGLGLPVVAIALLAPVLGLKSAMAIMVIPCFITNIWQGLSGGNFINIIRRIWPLLLTSFFGIWFGVYFLAVSNTYWLTAFFGLMLSIYSAFSLARPQIPPPGKWEAWTTPMAGGISGFTFGLTGSYMVPGVLYIQALGLNRDMLVQTLGIIFILITGTLGLSLTSNNLMPAHLGYLSAIALAPTAAGIMLGLKLRRRISEEQFRRIFFWALLLIGIYMMIRALI